MKLAQVGAVREGVIWGGELDSGSASWLEPPATPWGEAGGQGWGSITWSELARLDPSMGGGAVLGGVPLVHHATLAPRRGGDGREAGGER